MSSRVTQAVLLAVLISALCVELGCRRRTHSPVPPAPLADTTAVIWQAPQQVAAGPAHAGPWRMNDSEFHYVDDPSVALRDDGSAALVWVDNQRKDLLFQRRTAEGQLQPAEAVNVSRSPTTFSWLPRVALSGDQLFVLWQEIVFSGGSHGGDIFFARSADFGRTFSEPRNLSSSLGGDGKGRLSRDQWDNGSLDLALGTQGQLYAAWTEYDGALWLSRSRDGGVTFSSPQQLAGSRERPARAPALASDHRGNLFLAWAVGEHAEAEIELQRSDDGGESFEPARMPRVGRGRADAPKIALDDSGLLHLVFEHSMSVSAPSHIYYAALHPVDGTTAARAISRESSGAGASFPSLAVSGQNVLVLWHHRARPGALFQGLGIAVSRDGGQAFSEPGLVPGTAQPELGANGSRQGKLMSLLATNRNGLVAVVSSHFATGRPVTKGRSVVRLIPGLLQ